MSKFSKSAGASLERYLHHWRERGALMKMPDSEPQTLPITIAISQEYGVDGENIARQVGEYLGWPVYDREIVEMISEDTGVRSQLLESIDKRSPNTLAECLDAFQHEKTISGSGYAIRLLKVLFALSGHGNCIILGRGAAQVLPARRTLRVRLIAPIADRIDIVKEKERVTYEEAKSLVEEIDTQRATFVRSYFHKEIDDPHCYDLIVNPLKYSSEQVVEMIVLTMKDLKENLSEEKVEH